MSTYLKDNQNLILKRTANRNSKFNYLKQNLNQNVLGEDGGIIPISGGNAYATATYISLYANQDTLTYKLYLLEEIYWTGLFQVSGCKKLEKIWKSLMVTAWNYGEAGIKKVGDEYHPVGLVTYELDYNQDILKAKGFINNISFLGANFNKSKITEMDLNKNDTFLKFNYRGISAVWLYLPFCFQIRNHYLIYASDMIYKSKKTKYIINNEDESAINTELNIFYDLKNMVIAEVRNSQVEGIPNKFEPIEAHPSIGGEILNDLAKFKKQWYYQFGRRFSAESEKKEREINAEYEHQELQYTIFENEIGTELEKGIKRHMKIHGCKAKLIKTSDIVKVKEAKFDAYVQKGGGEDATNI